MQDIQSATRTVIKAERSEPLHIYGESAAELVAAEMRINETLALDSHIEAKDRVNGNFGELLADWVWLDKSHLESNPRAPGAEVVSGMPS